MKTAQSEWRSEIPATLEAIEQFCKQFRCWREETCASVNLFATELVLREALTNAVVHASAGNPQKHVHCVLRADARRLLVSIQDEGDGFDWRRRASRPVDDSDTHGRGLAIFKHYASAFRFNRKGNSITLLQRFSEGTTQ